MNLIPGLSLRAPQEDEEVGMDDCQLGEFAYDYVELTRHVPDSITHVHTSAIVSSNSSAHEKIVADKV